MRLSPAFNTPFNFSHNTGLAKQIVALVCALCVWGIAAPTAFAQTTEEQIIAAQTSIDSLQKQITVYEQTLKELGTQKNTLQNTIQSLDVSRKKVSADISITQVRITQKNAELNDLENSITDKTERIESEKKTVAESLRRSYQLSDTNMVEMILDKKGFTEIWDEIAALTAFNTALQKNMAELAATKMSLSETYAKTETKRGEYLSLKKQLTGQQAELDQNRRQQNALLAETKSNETTYQKLLAEAKAQLASFTAFVQNAGETGLLSDQTVCDDWGCYYNQRDSAWGNIALNRTQYTLANAGCLVSSVAMILTHYGYRSVTPISINSDPSNFASYFPAYLLTTIRVGEITATRTRESVTRSIIDSILAKGEPVILGLKVYDGTHFIVIQSGKNGSYVMRDPYFANGNKANFSDRYSLKSVFQVNRVVVSI